MKRHMQKYVSRKTQRKQEEEERLKKLQDEQDEIKKKQRVAIYAQTLESQKKKYADYMDKL
jgi:hypothetical protein